MIRIFIFDEDKSHWLEEERNLLSHDICTVLDEENETIYLWRGPKSNKEKFRKAYNQLKELLSNFSKLTFQIILTKTNFPLDIQNKIDSMIESMKLKEEKTLNFNRFSTIKIFSISIIISITLPILLFVFLSSSLTWNISDGNYEVNSSVYDFWIDISRILTLITIIFFSIDLIIGIIEHENQIILFSLSSLILLIGLLLYLNQGIFLFLFQDGSTLTKYFILQIDLIIFLLIILITILIFEIPNIYKLISFFKTYRKFIF